ncbi:MAG: SIMPL domain-containing protein, partial [Rectinemataceae bacterium]
MLKKSGFALLLLLAVFSVQAQTLPQTPTIRVSGDAKSTVDADMAVLSLGIVQQAKTPLAVREAVTAAADKVVTSLLALGVEKKQIRTSNFSIYPQYDERPGKQNLIIGYKGEAIITLT